MISTPPFQFKHFLIKQKKTAMKVGTDGVLLGSWTTISEGDILDIGTGTGLIAIMLAQRTKKTLLDAVEIELSAYNQATENVTNCTWAGRIAVHNISIQDYLPTKKYDVIVSNPPFFSDSTKAPNLERNTARHTDSLSFSDLITAVIRLLKPNGIFSLILPITSVELFIELSKKRHLFLAQKCMVNPNLTKPVKRVLMEFSFQKKEIITTEITIETKTRHQYTKEYISLTKDFYLRF